MTTHTVKIKDIGQVVTGSTPPTANSEFYGDEYLFIKPSDLEPSVRRVLATETMLSGVGRKYLQTRLLPKDATCVVCIGTIGKIGLTSVPCFTNQQINSVIPDETRYDPIYVYYLLRTAIPKVQKFEGGSASGRQLVKKSLFEQIEVDVHPLPTQRRIASILSAYDDLIENNTRRIKILEQMAQAIYREWFVEFRAPGVKLRKATSEEQKVTGKDRFPVGWEIRSLGDVLAEIESGSRPKGGIDPSERGVPSIGAENIAGLGQYDYGKERFVSRAFFDNMNRGHVRSGDVLLYKDGAYIGRKSIDVFRNKDFTGATVECDAQRANCEGHRH